jgi:hypothetical protein
MRALFDFDTWREIVTRAAGELGATLASFVPHLLGAFAILAVGWLLSRSLEIAAGRLLHVVGLDRAAARLHLYDVLARAGVRATLSQIIARLLFWLLLLTFLLSAVETLGLTAVTSTLDRLIAYIPNVIGAALIAVFGLLLARFAGSVVGSGAAAAGFPGAQRVGLVAQGLAAILVLAAAAEQLGVSTDVLIGPITALLAAAGFAAGLAFALGARPIVTHILAGHFLQQSLPRDGFVEVDGRRGRVERVGPTETLLRDGERSWSVPNGQLLERVVSR